MPRGIGCLTSRVRLERGATSPRRRGVFRIHRVAPGEAAHRSARDRAMPLTARDGSTMNHSSDISSPDPDHESWPPTRAAALDRLRDFLPHAGRTYASERNTDYGPNRRTNVSTLSPYLRRRILSEEEVVAAVLHRHSASAADKFIQEVYWRTYWKGWLEMRPRVWADYLADLSAARALLDRDDDLASRLQRAENGATGIQCFDYWAAELVDTGYLHNHTRMWFASIWMFTLGLPWVLGADFFFRHLLDADPASNTLSWRWVAGLHTKGKFYIARAENILEFTDGRFDPRGELDEDPAPIADARIYDRQPLRPTPRPDHGLRSGLLLTEDDLRGTSPRGLVASSTAFLAPAQGLRSPRSLDFSRRAMDDTFARLMKARSTDVRPEPLELEDVAGWAEDRDLEQIVVPDPGVGETAAALDELESRLGRRGVRLVPVRRTWDDRLFPHARAGFFRFKKILPDDLQRIQSTSTAR